MNHSPFGRIGTTVACASLVAACVAVVSCKSDSSGDRPVAAGQEAATSSDTNELQERVEKQEAGMKAILRKLVGTYAANPDSLQFKDETFTTKEVLKYATDNWLGPRAGSCVEK